MFLGLKPGTMVKASNRVKFNVITPSEVFEKSSESSTSAAVITF
jgi:hypothetical protein